MRKLKLRKKMPMWLRGGLIGFIYSFIATSIMYTYEFITGGTDPNLIGIILMAPALLLSPILAIIGPIIKNLFPSLHSDERFVLVLLSIVLIVTLIGSIIGLIIGKKKDRK